MAAKNKTTADAEDRAIVLISGESGAGKSYLVGSLKKALIYDTDLGGGLAYMDSRIQANGSERIELSSYRDILADLRLRAKEDRLPETIVIDHLTTLQQEAILRHNPNLESDYGRGGNKATYEWRQLREFIRTFDCNLFCVAHVKGEWKGNAQIGTIADGAKNIEGDMHIVLRVESKRDAEGRKAYPSRALVMKWRRLPEDPKGPVPSEFAFTLAEFQKIFGADYSRQRIGVKLASEETIKMLRNQLEFLGEDRKKELSEKWLMHAAVDNFEQMTQTQVEACVTYIQQQLRGAVHS